MKKLTVTLLTIATLLLVVTPTYAGTKTVTAVHPITKEIRTITVQDNYNGDVTVAEAASKFNGKYYPVGYWVDQVDGKGSFVSYYKDAFTLLNSDIKNFGLKGASTQYANDMLDMEWTLLTDKYLYENVTKQFLDKYPVLVSGTPEQKTKRQLEQLEVYLKWLAANTEYNSNLSSSSYTFNGNLLNDTKTNQLLDAISWDTVKDEKSANVFVSKRREVLAKSISNNYKQLSPTVKLSGVCENYADLTVRVLQQMGINNVRVGTNPSNVVASHAWNIVQFANGGVMHLDTTSIEVSGAVVFQAAPAAMSIGDIYNDLGSTLEMYNKNLKTSTNIYKDTKAVFEVELVPVATALVYPQGDIVKVFGSVENTYAWAEKFKNIMK